MTVTRVGFLGTGLMGSGMAVSLARKGFQVAAYNRTASRALALAGAGVQAVGDPAAVARGAQVVVCMLTDARVLTELLGGGLVAALAPGTSLVDCSTSEPAESQAVAARLRKLGVSMLDAPVFGSKNAAESGELTFLVGGERGTYEECLPLFEAMGTRSFYLGSNGLGCQAKLGFNMVIAGTIQAFAEALALSRRAGLEPATLVEIIMAGRARSGIIEMKAGPMLARDYTPFFSLKHMKKDLELIARSATLHGLDLPLAARLKDTYGEAMAAGLGDLDFSAIVEAVEAGAKPDSGVPRAAGGAGNHVRS